MPPIDVFPAEPVDPAATLLAAVTSGLSVVREPRLVRARLEEELRSLVNARSVAVRDCPVDASRRPDAITFDVPSAPWTMPARLEAVFEPARPVSEWERRTLSMGAQVASLLVQIEYATGGGIRLPRDDSASALIGSSPAIRRVRDRIERVAGTDFTVLVEGGSGPQPHPGFVEVLDRAALDHRHGTVARAGEDAPFGLKRPKRSALSPDCQRQGSYRCRSRGPSQEHYGRS